MGFSFFFRLLLQLAVVLGLRTACLPWLSKSCHVAFDCNIHHKCVPVLELCDSSTGPQEKVLWYDVCASPRRSILLTFSTRPCGTLLGSFSLIRPTQRSDITAVPMSCSPLFLLVVGLREPRYTFLGSCSSSDSQR